MAVIVSKPYQQMQREYCALCRELAESADRQYRQCLDVPLYIMGRRETGVDTLCPQAAIWTELAVMPEDSEGWTVVYPQPLSRAITVEHQTEYLRRVLGKEPLYIFAD